MSITVMKQALEALENLQPIIGNGLLDARQLAFVDPHLDVAITALRTAIAEAEKQDPIGYVFASPNLIGSVIGVKGQFAPHEVPLYLAPQPAHEHKPLTDDEIDAACRFIEPSFDGPIKYDRLIARAIEQAHGIKENT